MHTKILPADDPNALPEALAVLQRGEVVAVPTDTVYGIAADGWDAVAVEQLFIAKDRPSNKAIILLMSDYKDLERVASYVSPTAQRLAERFWPGGLTLVVQGRSELPGNLRAETNTIGVRVPNSNVVRELVRALGRPVAVTSANRSGGMNPVTAQDVANDLDGRISLILDGGATPGNVPSTVLDCTVEPPRLLRAGAVSAQELESALGLALST